MANDVVTLRFPIPENEGEWEGSYHNDQSTQASAHAIAYGRLVCGVSDHFTVSWRTSLPHTVVGLISNASIIVAATDGGTVSFLRGCDGQVLATRTVGCVAPRVSFVAQNNNKEDAVLIETSSSIVLVSLIDGQALNSDDKEQVAVAARRLQINTFQLKIYAAQAYAVEGTTCLSITGIGENGKLAVYETTKDLSGATLSRENVGPLSDDYTLDPTLVPHVVQGKMYLAGSARNDKSTTLYWWDPSSCKTVCSYQLPRGSKVHRIVPVDADPEGAATAVAVSLRLNSKEYSTRIIQLVVEDVLGLVVMTSPHSLFDITGSKSHTIAGLKSPFGVLTQSTLSETIEFQAFTPSEQAWKPLASLKTAIAGGDLDKAERILEENRDLDWVNLPFSKFHPSELGLYHLEALMSSTGPLELSKVQDYLQRLASGAAAGYTEGLTRAAASVRQMGLPFDITCSALTGVISAIDCSLKINEDRSSTSQDELRTLKRDLHERLLVVKYLGPLEDSSTLPSEVVGADSISKLFISLIKESEYGKATALWESEHQSRITGEVLVSAIVSVRPDVDVSCYKTFLSETVLPNLYIQDESLPYLRAWACRTADAFDREGASGLESAIELLFVVARGIRKLQLQLHQPLAGYSPFVSGLSNGARKPQIRRTPRAANNHSSDSIDCGFVVEATSKTTRCQRPVPTVLQLKQLSGGATKLKRNSYFKKIAAEVDDDYLEREDCIEDKLRDAQCLLKARSLGFQPVQVRLVDFAEKGGASFCAKELVKLCCHGLTSLEEYSDVIAKVLRPFCQSLDVDCDSALIDSAHEICSSKSCSSQGLLAASSVVRCCESVAKKCQGILVVIQSGLTHSCTEEWLLELGTEAIGWASSDSGLQSELVEASRLLRIDGIVLKYCGKGAKELFRVDNPRHAVRLLQYVSSQYKNPDIFGDVSSLCEAFTHLSLASAYGGIFQQMLLQEDSITYLESTITKLFQQDKNVAEQVLAAAVAFAEETLRDVSNRRNEHSEREARRVTEGVLALLTTAHTFTEHLSFDSEGKIFCYTQDGSIDHLIDLFSRTSALHEEFGVLASLSSLVSPVVQLSIAADLLSDQAASLIRNESANLKLGVEKARRGVGLLTGNAPGLTTDLWQNAGLLVILRKLQDKDDEDLFQLMAAFGLLDPRSPTQNTAHAHIGIAMALSLLAAKATSEEEAYTGMARMARATALIRDQTLRYAYISVLPLVVSIGGILDTLVLMFGQADQGVGEQFEAYRASLVSHIDHCSTNNCTEDPSNKIFVQVHLPIFRKSWYVGDGLLLPPGESLELGMKFCKSLLGSRHRTTGAGTILQEFVGARGAFFQSLRVGLVSTSVLTCTKRTPSNSKLHENLSDAGLVISDTLSSLAERSLGGSDSGITSGTVDSELAVIFLLSLPMKQAFDVYKAALPSAIKTRSFGRVFNLANVGRMASYPPSKQTDCENLFSKVAWGNQSKFLEQCEALATRAKWWRVLDDHNVEFDTQGFGLSNPNSVSSDSTSITKVVHALLKSCAPRTENSKLLELCCRYAQAFGLQQNIVLQKHVEYFLSTDIDKISSSDVADRRESVRYCQKVVQSSLDRLEFTERSLLLRQIVLELESSGRLNQDYERYSIIFSFYHDTLANVLDNEMERRNVDVESLEYELELIDRRRDALSILSAFYNGGRRSCRPRFASFFEPLEAILSRKEEIPRVRIHSVLQDDISSSIPIMALDDTLIENQETVTALAPLCLPLGLPQGYIHARSLVVRFREAIAQRSAFPSLENDISPVLNRLRSHADKCALSEWCAEQYESRGQEQLACLELALPSAIEASTEAERRLSQTRRDNEELLTQEAEALATVKRISTKKDALRDRQKACQVLNQPTTTCSQTTKKILLSIALKLEEDAREDPSICSEKLVEYLVNAASQSVAAASMDMAEALTSSQLRQTASVIGEACIAISNQYSHVHPVQQTKRMARAWLLYKSSYHNDSATEEAPKQDPEADVVDLEVDQTNEFVMDMTDIDHPEAWEAQNSDRSPEARVTFEEEPSLYNPCSLREKSESQCTQSIFRIAFALAVAEVCSEASRKNTADDTSSPKENKAPNIRSRRGLLAKVETRRDGKQGAELKAMCKELLCVVFAKSGASLHTNTSTFSSFDSETSRSDVSRAPPSITFAIRYKALRAAALLFPQEVIQQVMEEESMIDSSAVVEIGSYLRSCSFAVFVAKEIEEMGFALPHSDLNQLSKMHYQSFARSLWRNHRDGDMNGCKGRLLLLLVELSLRDSDVDVSFVDTILQEMCRLNLPRSLLLAMEHITRSKAAAKDVLLKSTAFRNYLTHVVTCTSSESKSATASHEVAQTIARLESLLITQNETTWGPAFVKLLSELPADQEWPSDDMRDITYIKNKEQESI